MPAFAVMTAGRCPPTTHESRPARRIANAITAKFHEGWRAAPRSVRPSEMTAISPAEQAVLDHVSAAPMLEQVQAWAAVNSGSRNLDGLARLAAMLADAFSALPGHIRLIDPAPVESVSPDGVLLQVGHGRHLFLSVRSEAPVRVLLTGHMDTVFAADHPFQAQRWLDDAVLNGPGVADMKGGLAIMLAALQAVETWEG